MRLIIVIIFLLMVGGCSYLRTFPLYSEVYVEHPELVKLDYYDNPNWWDYRTLSFIRKQIGIYLENNPNISPDVKDALQELTIKKGMNKEQVELVIAKPSRKKMLDSNVELWIYNKNVSGTLRWYYGWGKLKFKDGILIIIEVQFIHIAK